VQSSALSSFVFSLLGIYKCTTGRKDYSLCNRIQVVMSQNYFPSTEIIMLVVKLMIFPFIFCWIDTQMCPFLLFE